MKWTLRSLFLLTTIVAIAAAWYAYYSNASLRQLNRDLLKLRAWSEFTLKSDSDRTDQSFDIKRPNGRSPQFFQIFRTPFHIGSEVNGQRIIKRYITPNGFFVHPPGREAKNIDEAIEIIRGEFDRTQ
jgi:hypothetical protein